MVANHPDPQFARENFLSLCGEWEFGGLPAWLLTDRTMRPRSRDPKFLACVARYYDALMPILLLVSFEIIVSVISMKSIRFRDFVQGKPIFVMRDGKIKEDALRRLRLTGDDLIDAMRQKDVFDLATVKDAVMETNGTISVLQRTENTPPDAQTLGVQTQDGGCPVVIVLDGKPVPEYFFKNKIRESEIDLVVASLGIPMEDLLVLTIDNEGKTFYLKKEGRV